MSHKPDNPCFYSKKAIFNTGRELFRTKSHPER